LTDIIRKSAEILTDARIVFWDFDGVIKDSADLKVQAYVDMFVGHGPLIQNKIYRRYKAEGGKSRFQLIPMFYQDIVGVFLDDEQLNIKLKLYSDMVVNNIIECPFIPGVVDYLKNNYERQRFVIVTNTPQFEIEMIVKKLKLDMYFEAIFGAPKIKEDVVRGFLDQPGVDKKNCVFIGDSKGDFVAARNNGVTFIYRGNDRSGCYKHRLRHFQF